MPSPRTGGVGVAFVTVDHLGQTAVQEEFIPGWKGATNNQMEIRACIEALKIAWGRRPPFDLSSFSKIVIYTDSMYVSQNLVKAKFEWPANRWKTRAGPPVRNTRRLNELLQWVKRADSVGLRVHIQIGKGEPERPVQ
jgi:ribonuclease HI